jgi:hypothetical protein
LTSQEIKQWTTENTYPIGYRLNHDARNISLGGPLRRQAAGSNTPPFDGCGKESDGVRVPCDDVCAAGVDGGNRKSFAKMCVSLIIDLQFV